jgi:hypothetical protein
MQEHLLQQHEQHLQEQLKHQEVFWAHSFKLAWPIILGFGEALGRKGIPGKHVNA